MGVTSPTDPVCPECGEAVGSTSTYCMHCDADFDAPIDASEFAGGSTTATGQDDGDWGGSDQDVLEDDANWGDSDTAVTDHPSGWDDGGPGDAGHTEGWSPDDDPTTSTTTDSTTTESTTGADPTPESVSDYGTTDGASADAAGTTTGGGAEREDGGTGRNLLQSLARIGAVLLVVVVGLVTTGALALVTGEFPGVWIAVLVVGLLGIVTGGIVIARQDTGIDALADALYVTATVVVGLPFVFFLLLPTGDPIGEKLLLGVVFSFFGAFVGVPAFVLGWFLQPDDEGVTGM